MNNQTVLLILAVATVAAFGVLMSSAANAEPWTTGSEFSLLSTAGAVSPLGFMLIKDGHGGGGGKHGGKHWGGHHGGHHWKHWKHWGYSYPYYYDNYSCWKCYWKGHKKVCYNTCDEWY